MSRDGERSSPRTEHGWSFEETAHRQLLAGLEMTPLERLRWLDRRKKELQRLLGRAAEAAGPATSKI